MNQRFKVGDLIKLPNTGHYEKIRYIGDRYYIFQYYDHHEKTGEGVGFITAFEDATEYKGE